MRLTLPLSLLVLGAVALAYQWSDWPPSVPESLPGSGDPQGSGGHGHGDPLAGLESHEPREAYASVTDRPLFRPQRKPPDPVAGLPGPVSDDQPAVDLTGLDLSAVVISPSVVSAWVRDSKEQGLKRVRLGDELEGWSVKDILGDRVVLERQGERNELLLRDFSKAPPPASPPPRARPPPATQRMPQRLPPRPPLQRHSSPGQEPGVILGEPAEPDESTPDGSNP